MDYTTKPNYKTPGILYIYLEDVNNMSMNKVMVIGAGQMGSGIAQVCAQAGYDVLLNDLNEEALNKGMKNIEKHLSRSVEKERLTSEEKDEPLAD